MKIKDNELKEYSLVKEVTKNPRTVNFDNEYAWYIKTY